MAVERERPLRGALATRATVALGAKVLGVGGKTTLRTTPRAALPYAGTLSVAGVWW